MKHISTLIMAVFAASPALAHGGVHMHPHGAEVPLLLLGTGLIAVAAVLAYKR